MKYDFDKILSDKIREVSNNNEIPYNPEHWNMLQAKVKNEKKRVFFYWKIAAFLLITLLAGGIGTYLFNLDSNIKNNRNPQIILDTKNDSLRIDSLKTNKAIFITSSDFDSINNNSKTPDIDSINFRKKHILPFKNNTKKLENGIAKNTKIATPNSINIKVDSSQFLTNNLLNNKALANSNTKLISKTLVSDSIVNSVDIAENHTNTQLKKDTLAIKEDLLATLEKTDEVIEKASKKSLKFGVEVSPIFDYNQDNGSSNIGFAGGITVEIPISSKFDVNTGVFYADQKLNLNQSSALYSDVVSAKSNSQLITEEAVIKGIEIPLNVTYNFTVAKKDLFVAAGVTSTKYIKENIEANYLVNERSQISTQDFSGNNIVKYELVQTNSEITTEANSNTFNFANYLNVSFGIKLPINNQRQSITIAPYFKYSLKPLTNQQIDFNSGGVHLRYNFSFSKNN
ncbi:hypothetical protein MHL31_03390 [Lutibacter sp. A80]|uniref:hypothetical protein n=1 Tax=Lutibacter sp. A80 TaxID=2918453 RepID=UPI001F05434E|nr:hypothetical protein [Lutibacter sp. A80]UMB61253.1 hypothetical protein MHL31_03390 [Lutibacter sp. A80]